MQLSLFAPPKIAAGSATYEDADEYAVPACIVSGGRKIMLDPPAQKPDRSNRQSPAFDAEELFEVLDMVPRPAANVNWEEAGEITQAILYQAVEDFLESRQNLIPPEALYGSHRRQWLRMARSRAKKVEMNRRDAEEFFFSAWYDRLCGSLGLDPDVVRDAVFAQEIQ